MREGRVYLSLYLLSFPLCLALSRCLARSLPLSLSVNFQLVPFFPGLDAPNYWETYWAEVRPTSESPQQQSSASEPETVRVVTRRKAPRSIRGDFNLNGDELRPESPSEERSPNPSPTPFLSLAPTLLSSLPSLGTNTGTAVASPGTNIEQEWAKIEEEKRQLQKQQGFSWIFFLICFPF